MTDSVPPRLRQAASPLAVSAESVVDKASRPEKAVSKENYPEN